MGAARPLPPSADIGPGGQSVGQAATFCLAPSTSCRRHTRTPNFAAELLVVDQLECRSARGREKVRATQVGETLYRWLEAAVQIVGEVRHELLHECLVEQTLKLLAYASREGG